jgi:hypothetical protein
LVAKQIFDARQGGEDSGDVNDRSRDDFGSEAKLLRGRLVDGELAALS